MLPQLRTLLVFLSGLVLDGCAEELSNLDLPRQVCAPKSRLPSFLWPSPLHRYRFILEPDDNTFSVGADPELQILAPLSTGGICDLLSGFCEWIWDCNKEICKASCSWVSKDRGCAVDFPPSGGCVKIKRLAKGALRSSFSWELGWDFRVVLHVAAGAALFWGRTDLREAKVVHALIGAIFIVMLGIMMMMYFLFGQTRKMASGIPLLGMFVTLSPLLILTAPSWYLMTVAPTSWKYMWPLLQPWLCGVSGLCIGAVVAVFGARCGLKWFASDFEAPPKIREVEFTIGSDGRRIDNLHAEPWQQRLLGFFLGVVGIMLLLSSTYNKYLSAFITLLVLLKNRAAHYFWEIRALKEVVKPEYFRSLMSQGDFEEEGYKRTSQALDALRDYASSNPEIFLLLHANNGDDRRCATELRFRRFVDGWDHIQLPCEEEDDPSDRWCTIL